MHAHDVTGDMVVTGPSMVEGWCWSPSRPAERLTVAIEVDDRAVAFVRASSFRPDLLENGIGDGRHAFAARLPSSGADVRSCMISAREQESRIIFGRRVLRSAQPDDERSPLPGRATELSSRLAAIEASGSNRPVSTAVRDAALELATVLASGPASGTAAARRLLAGLTRGLRLAEWPWPALSVIVPPEADAASAVGRIRDLVPLVNRLQGEILLLDDGQDARIALLPSLIHGLRVERVSRPAGVEECLASASVAARGHRLVLISATAVVASAAAIEAVLQTPPEIILAGPTLHVSGMQPFPVAAATGVDLVIPRATLASSGPGIALKAAFRSRPDAPRPVLALQEPWAPIGA